jgi:hypothetical protein
MSERIDTNVLMKEIWPDTESDEDNDQIKENENGSDLESENENNNENESESEEFIIRPKINSKSINKPKLGKKDASNPRNLVQEIPNVNDALFEYYRLKEKFENEVNMNKRKIINNQTLSKREKRSEFLKLMPKCVNCRRPSKKGSIFSITYHPSNDKTDAYKAFKAYCGDLANPCNFAIEINVGVKNKLDEELNAIRNEIDKVKKNIINDKNKLLFGLITTETALENFDSNKSYITDLTSIYENYLDKFNDNVDNLQRSIELEEVLIQSYQAIHSIKDCIKKMNENNDRQFAIDAATIYQKTLEPLLNKIRHLKYKENMVFYDDNNNCKLVQKKYSLDDILISGYNSNVVAYDVGLKVFKKKQGSILFEPEKGLEKELSIKIIEPDEQKQEIDDEPIIGQGKDGIAWNNSEYQKLWDKLPEKLKIEFKTNIDWMKEFMHKCVNERIKHGPQWNGCRLIAPSNLVIPPRVMSNGQYDFGVSIYNKAFSKLANSTQKTYLTLYSEDSKTKEKNYTMLIDSMNQLVENEVGFGRGFF